MRAIEKQWSVERREERKTGHAHEPTAACRQWSHKNMQREVRCLVCGCDPPTPKNLAGFAEQRRGAVAEGSAGPERRSRRKLLFADQLSTIPGWTICWHTTLLACSDTAETDRGVMFKILLFSILNAAYDPQATRRVKYVEAPSVPRFGIHVVLPFCTYDRVPCSPRVVLELKAVAMF